LWRSTLTAISKGRNPLDMNLIFKSGGWKDMTAEKAVGLIDHLPHTVTELIILDADLGVGLVEPPPS